MSQAFADLVAFQEGLQGRFIEIARQRLQQSPQALADWQAEAWDQRSLPKIIAASLVLREHGLLKGKEAHRAAVAFNAMRRYREALEAQKGAGETGASLQATALAGLGRFGKALDQARIAAAAGRKQHRTETRRDATLETVIELGPQLARGGSVEQWARYLDACLLLDALEHVRSMAPTFSRQVDALYAEDPKGVLALAESLLTAGAADEVAAILRRLRPRRPKDGRLLGLLAEAETRRGHPATAMALLPPEPSDNYFVLRGQGFTNLALGRTTEGIHALAIVSRMRSKVHAVLEPLAKAVGRQVLDSAAIPFRAEAGPRRVINILPFVNEVDLLKLRMAEMAPWVDHFVIVESAQTFTGQDKPLHFEAIKSEFAPYLDKIRHVRIDEFPAHICSPWARDYYQRDMAIPALAGVWGPDDVVLVTDADEIIRRDVLDRYEGDLMTLATTNHRYFINYVHGGPDELMHGPTATICKAEHLAREGASYIRFYVSRQRKWWNEIPRAGWHFSSMNTARMIALKYRNSAHTEVIKMGLGDDDQIAALYERIRAGEFQPGWGRTEIDERFPAYVRENRDAFADFIL